MRKRRKQVLDSVPAGVDIGLSPVEPPAREETAEEKEQAVLEAHRRETRERVERMAAKNDPSYTAILASMNKYGDNAVDGREAKCVSCETTRPSGWELSFFEYRPDRDLDLFYDGCRGWD